MYVCVYSVLRNVLQVRCKKIVKRRDTQRGIKDNHNRVAFMQIVAIAPIIMRYFINSTKRPIRLCKGFDILCIFQTSDFLKYLGKFYK